MGFLSLICPLIRIQNQEHDASFVLVFEMTKRFHSLAVVLENDIRKDDAEALMAAISQLRGVL